MIPAAAQQRAGGCGKKGSQLLVWGIQLAHRLASLLMVVRQQRTSDHQPAAEVDRDL